ncbi:hypothetical protein [Alkalihalobacillus sp. TS-13]|uniref:hypothetical protein n=1 Tax=Alkalihalobacillus sp. TS-13 TaxID=2842455 RepID=UPI001C88202E|nr:hypothetical protein [Alkalihalobacillus sp. TS-13]
MSSFTLLDYAIFSIYIAGTAIFGAMFGKNQKSTRRNGNRSKSSLILPLCYIYHFGSDI